MLSQEEIDKCREAFERFDKVQHSPSAPQIVYIVVVVPVIFLTVVCSNLLETLLCIGEQEIFRIRCPKCCFNLLNTVIILFKNAVFFPLVRMQ